MQQEIQKKIKDLGLESDLINHTAYSISEHKAIGWMQGRMEFGPRALGSRSIIADPRSPTMQKILNLKVKYRESFRPFAPSVLSEYVEEWFDMEVDSPYMLYIAKVNKHKTKVLFGTFCSLGSFRQKVIY